MSGSLLACLMLVGPHPSDLVGELTERDFLRMLANFGYTVSQTPGPYGARVSQGSESLQVFLGFHRRSESSPPYVGTATGYVAFDLPRALPKKALWEWRTREKLDGIQVHSFLGGKVRLERQLAAPRWDRDAVRARLAELFVARRRLAEALAPLGGKEATRLEGPGDAPLDLGAKLEDVEQEDLNYLRRQLRWGASQGAVGAIRGWLTGARLLGVTVWFSGMSGSKPGFFVTSLGRLEGNQLKRWPADAAERITWASVTLQDGHLHIQKWIDTSGGKTVREVRDSILDFARRVKALDVF